MEKQIIVTDSTHPSEVVKKELVPEKNPGQDKANEVMDQVFVSEIWRTDDNHWFTTEDKAVVNQTLIGGNIQHFTKN